VAKKQAPRIDGLFDWMKKGPAAPQPQVRPRSRFKPGVDYYTLLEVRADATDDEIRSSYRRLARQYHPDVNPSPEAAQMFKFLTDGYHVLTDQRLRREYDQFRASMPPAPVVATPPRRPPPGALIVPGPMEPPVTSSFQPFRPPPYQPPSRPAPPPERVITVWEELFGPPEEISRAPITKPSIFDPYVQATFAAAPPPSAAPMAPPQQFYAQPTAGFPSPEEIAAFIQSVWPIEAVWDFVREHRTTLEFRQTGTMMVDRFAGSDPRESVEYETAEWFGIIKELVDDYSRRGAITEIWKDIFYPMFDIAGMALGMIKPSDLPGYFFVKPDNGVVDLYYTEAIGRRPWK